MLDKITQKLKSEPYYGFLFMLILLFTMLFSFCILQSDDYSYASYLKDGLLNFLRLTKEHFLNINGRALVHFFLHITLALPKAIAVLIKSAILFLIGFFSFKLTEQKNAALYLTAVYSMLLLTGKDTFTEALMWSSGFFNYVFPALFLFVALYLYKKGSVWQYIFFVMAGSTTEQWGFTALVITTTAILSSNSSHRMIKAKAFLPSLAVLCGYITIFLSPATLSRITVSWHIPLSESLFDISRMAKAFLSYGSPVIIIFIFILTALVTAYLKKGTYTALYSGALPLFLIFTLPLHHSCMAAFILFLCYLVLCGTLFFAKKLYMVSAYIFGGAASVFIMLPANTIDSRITFPLALLLILATVTLISELNLSKKAVAITITSLFVVSVIVFCPAFKGYYKNYALDRQNLAAIKAASDTKQLEYSIDYDKNYAVKQMFNDGWFYNAFISLYDLEDCKVYLDSKNSATLRLDGRVLSSKAIISDGQAYIPLRAFIDEVGGIIRNHNGSSFVFNDKAITYFDGILTYTTRAGHEKYLIVDDNSLPDFYTLYIKSDIICDAFDVTLFIDDIN